MEWVYVCGVCILMVSVMDVLPFLGDKCGECVFWGNIWRGVCLGFVEEGVVGCFVSLKGFVCMWLL